jgi:putative transposase
MEIIKRKKGIKGFQLLPHRWKVERTFAWLGRHRRMSKDYEKLPQTGEALVHVIMIGLMLRRRAAAAAGGSGHPAGRPLGGRVPAG